MKITILQGLLLYTIKVVLIFFSNFAVYITNVKIISINTNGIVHIVIGILVIPNTAKEYSSYY